jgi:hypothetical protein
MKVAEAAAMVGAGVEETLCYMAFPREHWTRIRTNNMLERIMWEIRRRTRVVGNFPDGPSAAMLVAARHRYVAATRWGSRAYLDMERLREQEQEEQPTQIDEPLPPELVPPRGNQVRLPHTTNSQTKCVHLDRHYLGAEPTSELPCSAAAHWGSLFSCLALPCSRRPRFICLRSEVGSSSRPSSWWPGYASSAT